MTTINLQIPLLTTVPADLQHQSLEALRLLPNIIDAEFAPDHRTITVATRNPKAAVVQTISSLAITGIEVVKKIITLPVLSMTCASCATSVESMIQSQTGVIDASVNFAAASVRVEFIPSLIGPEQFQQVVQQIGYDLVLSGEQSADKIAENLKTEHYAELKSKTIWSAILTIPVVIIGMFYMDMPYGNEIMWLLTTPVLLYFGRHFFINAFKQAKHRRVNMDTLVAISTGVAYLFSVFNTLNPHYWHNLGLHNHVYFEAASVIIVFILLGKLLEERAKNSTSAALQKLIQLQPQEVTRITKDNNTEIVGIEHVNVGDEILVKPGEKIPLDGIVSTGTPVIDESTLSGESLPVQKNQGDKVFSGTINQNISFRFIAKAVGSDTVLARIIETVREAQGSKAPVQRIVDRVASIFVPIVILIALLTFAVWAIWGGDNGVSQGLLSLITVLVIACPCALGLATPTAIMVGVGKAAENGILIKDAESLETAKRVNAIVLDKTGTITKGKPTVTDTYWPSFNEVDEQVLYNIEMASEHPLASAIVKSLRQSALLTFTSFESLTGRGISAVVNDVKYLVGNKRLMNENNVKIAHEFELRDEQWGKLARTTIWISKNDEVIAVLAISDPIKPTSAVAINALQSKGIEVYMLTGDNEQTAAAVATQVGITNYIANNLPEDKLRFVRSLQQQGKIVGMVGDGINDSSALVQADLSIAMGHGSDIAMDVAKMTIISSDLLKVSRAIEISGETIQTIKQNLFWAFIYNLIGIPIAAGVLFPINGFLLNPMIAGGAMALSSVSVLANSLRLKYKKSQY